MKPRVSIEELSRLLDGELESAERRDIEARLAQCAVSQALKARLEALTQNVAGAILTASPPPGAVRGEDCLSDAALMALADNRLSADEKQAVENHILACERCLLLVLENLRTSASMRGGVWPDLPPEVSERREVRALVNVQEREPSPEDEGSICISLAAEMPVSHTFASEHLAVRTVLSPLSPTQAHLELVVKEGLRIKEGQEMVLTSSETKRKFFTGSSNAQGHCVVRHLPPGRYVAHFTNSQLKIEIIVEA